MKILILGGAQFVGRHLTETAVAAGHEVTLFNRGQTNPHLFPDLEKLVGDRTQPDAYAALKDRQWDAVIDVTAYFPRQVRELLEAIQPNIGHFTLISTMSVYAEMDKPMNEDSPLLTLEDPNIEEITGETYGGLKVLCEQEAEAGMPNKTLIVRPSYIIGPYDHTDRFTWWMTRTAQGGPMLAPPPDDTVPIIEGRDMAEWILRSIESDLTGIFTATGPEQPPRFGRLLEAIKQATDSDAEFIHIDAEFAQEHELLGPAMPTWNPGVSIIDNAKAIAAGLTFRPLAQIVEDTLAWRATAGEEDIKYPNIGLPPEREAELIELWKNKG